jgi:hypothetical protein
MGIHVAGGGGGALHVSGSTPRSGDVNTCSTVGGICMYIHSREGDTYSSRGYMARSSITQKKTTSYWVVIKHLFLFRSYFKETVS